MDPHEAAAISQVAKLQGFLPYLDDALEAMSERLMRDVFSKLDKEELTPDGALLAWKELQIYRRLLRKFDTQVRIGQATATRNAVELDSNPPTYGIGG